MKRKFCLTFSTTHILHCSIDVPPHYRLETCNLCTIENCTQFPLQCACVNDYIFSVKEGTNEGIGKKKSATTMFREFSNFQNSFVYMH